MLTSEEIFFAFSYTILFAIVILKVPYFKTFDLPAAIVSAIFVLKVFIGTIYGLIHYYLYNGGDTFSYFNDGKIVFSSIDSNGWWMYLQLVFGFTKPEPAADIVPYRDAMSYYTIMNSYFMVRFHALANLITGAHYYPNMVLYNFITLIGILYLFKFFYQYLPGKRNWIIIILFLVPSVAFWSSGIHKDGISLAAIGLILFFISKLSLTRIRDVAHIKTVIGLLTGIWLLWIVRNYLLLLLLPCVMAFVFTTKFPANTVLKFMVILVIFYAIAFNLYRLNPSWSLIGEMSSQQREFLQLATGKTTHLLPGIDNEFLNLLRIAPIAVYHCLFLPIAWNISSIVQLPSALDNGLLIMLIVLSTLYFQHPQKKDKPFILLCLLFGISVFIFTGSVVSNIGALVRYKMPGFLFITIGIVAMLNTDKLKRHLANFQMPKNLMS